MSQLLNSFELRLDEVFNETIVSESNDDSFFAAVAIVKYRDKWLLGLSTSSDDRSKKWCFPGGGIKKNESPFDAAVRECMEETGIKCTATKTILTTKDKKGVAFIPCKTNSKQQYKPNSEFSVLGFFTRDEFNSLTLYKNVIDLVNRAKKSY